MPDAPDDRAHVNRECVRAWLAAREGTIDFEAMGQFLTEDSVRYGPRPSFLEGGPLEGAGYPKGPAQGRKRQINDFEDPKRFPYQPGSLHEIEHMVAEGDYVTAQFVMRARTRAGKDYENFYHDLYWCENGKIKACWEYVDTLYSQRMLFDPLVDDEES
jgi:ketosteroid isomerase-like protein